MRRTFNIAIPTVLVLASVSSASITDAYAQASYAVNRTAGPTDAHSLTGAGEVKAHGEFQYSSSVNDVVYDMLADAHASGSYRNVKAYAFAKAKGPASGAAASANVASTFSLYVPPSHITRDHKKYIFTLLIHVTGQPSASINDATSAYTSSSMTYALSVNGGVVRTETATAGGRIGEPTSEFSETGDRIEVPLDVGYLDQDNTIVEQMSASVSASVSTTADPYSNGQATADFGSTFTWQGISAIHDEFGNSVPMDDFQLLDDEGRDWATVIVAPEPASATLLAAGCLGLIARRRR